MEEANDVKRTQIRALNDLLRCKGIGGQVVATAGLHALGDEKIRAVLRAVAAFEAFGEDNDPHGEHDCALVELGDLRIIWKIDYFDLQLRCHSPDASDPRATKRVMSVMLADEY